MQADLVGFAPYAAFRFLNMGEAARVGTMLHEFPRIAQLMLFPTRLSADYSPADVIIADGIGFSELPGILHRAVHGDARGRAAAARAGGELRAALAHRRATRR